MKRKIGQALLLVLLTIGMTWAFRPFGLWFDEYVMERLEAAHAAADDSFLYRMAEIAAIPGSTTVFTVVSIGVLLFLLKLRQNHMFWFMAVFLYGGVIVNTGLKLLMSRPRPYGIVKSMDGFGDSFHLISYSFPSGHAFRAVLLALALGILIACFSRFSLKVRQSLYSLLLLLAVGAIASRPILGVHYPTDVLAAAIYAFIWLSIVLRFYPRKIMEKKG